MASKEVPNEVLDEYIGSSVDMVAPFCSFWRPVKPVPFEDWVGLYNQILREVYWLGHTDGRHHDPDAPFPPEVRDDG